MHDFHEKCGGNRARRAEMGCQRHRQKPLIGMPSTFSTGSIDRLSEIIQTSFGAKITTLMIKDTELRAHGVQFGLPSTTLWSCSYGVPVRLKFPEGELLRIQFRQRGVGATQTGKEMIVVDESQSCIFAGEAEVFFGDDYTQLAWRVALGDLQRKLTALTGWSSARPLSFDPALNLRTPQARSMLSVLDSLIGLSDVEPFESARVLRSELESALLVALLCAARHNYSDVLERGVPAAAPWQVRRVESFIESNWDKPITIEDMVEASGASARSVFPDFPTEPRLYSAAICKAGTLRHAKRLLEGRDSTSNVTEIALSCGFSDLSRFSKDFSRAFGEPPSRFMLRKK